MIRDISIFEQSTGRILRAVRINEDQVKLQLGDNEDFVDGLFDNTQYYVDLESKVVTSVPQKPGEFFVFNFETKQWQYDQKQLVQQVLIRRYGELAMSDWTDTVSAVNRLGKEKYDQWQIYRQSLRDIPQQPGYPEGVVWPLIPQ